jgi:hypothetical protein
MGHAGGWTLPFTRPARQRAASPKNDFAAIMILPKPPRRIHILQSPHEGNRRILDEILQTILSIRLILLILLILSNTPSLSPPQHSLSLLARYSRVNWHLFPAHSAFDAGKAVFMFFSGQI